MIIQVEKNKNLLVNINKIKPSTCPSCWGHSEWEGNHFEVVQDKHLKTSIYQSFVSKIVERHVLKAHKHENKYICKNCDQEAAA